MWSFEAYCCNSVGDFISMSWWGVNRVGWDDLSDLLVDGWIGGEWVGLSE